MTLAVHNPKAENNQSILTCPSGHVDTVSGRGTTRRTAGVSSSSSGGRPDLGRSREVGSRLVAHMLGAR